MKASVCVSTYQRPQGLKRLIEGLNELTFSKCEPPSIEVLVVDNDATGPACRLLKGICAHTDWPLRCVVEPRRGISYARNTAIALAQEVQADFIVFIDDDEVPEACWLDELLYVQRLYDADVVAGPVLPHFGAPVARWVEEGKFFDRRRLSTGTPIEWAATNNVLVRSEVFDGMEKIFDERYALTGGSDRDFFARVSEAGYEMVWADEALVHEWIPKSRANLRWLLQRRYRNGNFYSLRKIELDSSIVVRANLVSEARKLIVSGLLRFSRSVARLEAIKLIVRSLLRFPRLAVKRQAVDKIRRAHRARVLQQTLRLRHEPLIRSLLRVSRGMGILAGVVGWRYEEYRRIHGA